MKITPKYDSVIRVPNHFSIEIYFTSRPSKVVVNQIEELGATYGVEVKQILSQRGRPWVIYLSPVYDPKEVALEVERFLKEDGWKNINVIMAAFT